MTAFSHLPVLKEIDVQAVIESTHPGHPGKRNNRLRRFQKNATYREFPPEGCYVYLRRRIATSEIAARRNGWFGGRIINRINDADPHYVRLPGSLLQNLYGLAQADCPLVVKPNFEYYLRRDLAEQFSILTHEHFLKAS